MWPRLSAFVVWSLVAATLVFWTVRVFVRSPEAPSNALEAGQGAAPRGDLARLFGSAPVLPAAVQAVPAADARFRLIGVMAPKGARSGTAARYGLALISVDGKPPRAFQVGSRLDTRLVLQSVGWRSASIGPADGARELTIELPAMLPAATGRVFPAQPESGVPSPPQTMPAMPMAPAPMPGMPVPGMSQPMPMPMPPATAPDTN